MFEILPNAIGRLAYQTMKFSQALDRYNGELIKKQEQSRRDVERKRKQLRRGKG